MPSSHVCPVGPCTRMVLDHQLMCSEHWRLVPPDVGRHLYRAWGRGAGAGTAAHETAMRECIREVHQRIGHPGGW